jgi:hypothetical protein
VQFAISRLDPGYSRVFLRDFYSAYARCIVEPRYGVFSVLFALVQFPDVPLRVLQPMMDVV